MEDFPKTLLAEIPNTYGLLLLLGGVLCLIGLGAWVEMGQFNIPPPGKVTRRILLFLGPLLVGASIYCSLFAAEAPKPTANGQEVIIDPGYDPDRPPATIPYKVVIDRPDISDNSLKTYFRKAKEYARKRVESLYERDYGISTVTLIKAQISLDTFIHPFSWQINGSGNKFELILKVSFESDPEIRFKVPEIKLPEPETRMSIDDPIVDMDFRNSFGVAVYRLNDLQKFNINRLANELLEMAENLGKTVTIVCEGYTDTNDVQRIAYDGASCWDGTGNLLPLSGKGIRLGNPLRSNEQLSYARAYEGITCMKKALEARDRTQEVIPRIRFLYVGKGQDATLTANDEKRRIFFYYKIN